MVYLTPLFVPQERIQNLNLPPSGVNNQQAPMDVGHVGRQVNLYVYLVKTTYNIKELIYAFMAVLYFTMSCCR